MASFMVVISRLTPSISSSQRLEVWTLPICRKILFDSRNCGVVTLFPPSSRPWSSSWLPPGWTDGSCCPTSWLLGSLLQPFTSCIFSRFWSMTNCMLAIKLWACYSRVATLGSLWQPPLEMMISCTFAWAQELCWATIDLVSTSKPLVLKVIPIDGANWWCQNYEHPNTGQMVA